MNIREINNDEDYATALAELGRLWSAQPGTPEDAQRATREAPIEDAPATIARLYTDFVTIVERPALGERRTHEEWQIWVQQVMGVLPH